MRVAILSDVHGHTDALRRAIEHARAQGASHFYNLGDTGNGDTYPVLATVTPASVIGNWEVSSWRTLPAPWRQAVRSWPFQRRIEQVILCHASPVWPGEVKTLEDAAHYVQQHGSWFALFPSLEEDENARWDAFASMAEQDATLVFHGHTHVQAAWQLRPDNHMRRLTDPAISIANDGSLYIVGVGSVGRPLDGPGICYALWDTEADQVTLQRVKEEE